MTRAARHSRVGFSRPTWSNFCPLRLPPRNGSAPRRASSSTPLASNCGLNRHCRYCAKNCTSLKRNPRLIRYLDQELLWHKHCLSPWTPLVILWLAALRSKRSKDGSDAIRNADDQPVPPMTVVYKVCLPTKAKGATRRGGVEQSRGA